MHSPLKEAVRLPLMVDKATQCREDIQGLPILLSPITESSLPKPIQPSLVFMKAALPNLLQPELKKDGSSLYPLPPPPLKDRTTKVRDALPKSIRSLLNPIPPMRLSKSLKQYRCSFCQKKFMRPSSLKIHVYSHTGEKPYHCSFPGCQRKFSVQSNMKRHLRVHLN